MQTNRAGVVLPFRIATEEAEFVPAFNESSHKRHSRRRAE
jgi:hypothetical protein